MLERLFVYGTLAPGRPNEHILGKIGGSWQAAWVTGTLHQAGWGAEMGFPGIRLDENGERVEGVVFSSENLSAHWPMLDEFEGPAYQRVSTTVECLDNTSLDAYIYALKSTTD